MKRACVFTAEADGLRNCGGVILDEYQFLHDDLTAWKGGMKKILLFTCQTIKTSLHNGKDPTISTLHSNC